ncbi:hypothetical protein HDV00_008629 [Rhizophlyctis rosea]|nr:hypothetical protein HDV00_008629 [Rhizophlyctis rosea]
MQLPDLSNEDNELLRSFKERGTDAPITMRNPPDVHKFPSKAELLQWFAARPLKSREESFSIRIATGHGILMTTFNSWQTAFDQQGVKMQELLGGSLGYYLGGSNDGAVTLYDGPANLDRCADAIHKSLPIKDNHSFAMDPMFPDAYRQRSSLRISNITPITLEKFIRTQKQVRYEESSGSVVLIRPTEELVSILKFLGGEQELERVEDGAERVVKLLRYPSCMCLERDQS